MTMKGYKQSPEHVAARTAAQKGKPSPNKGRFRPPPIGRVFGDLTVLEELAPRITPLGFTRRVVKCKCVCGSDVSTDLTSVTTGNTKSCGCSRGKANATHGHTRGRKFTAEYQCWAAMIARCEKSSGAEFHRYGGRGISVCERWRHSFENFFIDMGKRPPSMTLDRINNDGNYEPGNCQWATKAQQAKNTSQNVYLEFNGRRMTLTDWSRETGFAPETISRRLRANLPMERVFSKKRFIERKRPPQTHCKRGHPFTPKNTYTLPGKPYRRTCRICHLANVKAYQARHGRSSRAPRKDKGSTRTVQG